ncbi:MAG: hypothetical protein HDT27_07905 [Subdoligranulum sp.]|nr:hypothetical protein [Subdoligranulum sp.]
MPIVKMTEKTLTETQEETIRRFRYYYDCKKCFALIGDYAVAVLSDEFSGQVEKLEREARENFSALLNIPPDFSTYVMDDQFGLVEMACGIYAVSPEKLSEEEISSGKVSIRTALAMRGFCLEACRAGTILAINDEALQAEEGGKEEA